MFFIVEAYSSVSEPQFSFKHRNIEDIIQLLMNILHIKIINSEFCYRKFSSQLRTEFFNSCVAAALHFHITFKIPNIIYSYYWFKFAYLLK